MSVIDTITCPRCHQSKGFVQNKMKGQLTCNDCKYIFTDDQVTSAFGLVKCQDGSFETEGTTWKKFPCPYCMIFFDTFDKRVTHEKLNHKVGDFMMCMLK